MPALRGRRLTPVPLRLRITLLALALLCSGCASQRAWLGAHLLPGGQGGEDVAGASVGGTRADLGAEPDGPVAEVVLDGIAREDIQPQPVPLPCDAPPWRAERAEAEWREAIALARRRAGDYTPTINARISAPRARAPAAASEDAATSAPAPSTTANAGTAPPSTGPASATPAAAAERTCWRLRFQVIEGREAIIRTLNIALGPVAEPRLQAIIDAQPLRIGGAFSEARYEALKGALSREAEETGYFDAAFTEHRVDVYPEDAAADVALVFTPGNRYAFGDLRIDAPDVPLRPALIERMAPFRAGEPYLASAVDLLRTRLSESGYFTSVDVHPEPDAAKDGKVPIVAALTPLPRLAGTVGAGFATDIGPRAQFAYENRFVNDRGHQASAAVKVSPVIADATVTYRIPSNRPAERWWTLDLGAKRERNDEIETDTVTLGVRNVKLRDSGWRRTFGLDLSHERFQVGEDQGRSLLLVPSLRLERSVSTSGSFTTTTNSGGPLDTGWRAAFVVSGAHEQALSDVSFLQVLLEGRYAFMLGDRARVLARLEGGTSLVAGFAELPPSYRLYAGGDDSVRGYDFKTLGPRDNQNEVRGGRHRITASIEYERLFLPSWSWAVFADSGNAFDDLPVGMRTGVGLGVRWHSPVGSVRIDLAHPLSDSDQTVRLHIGIGRVQ